MEPQYKFNDHIGFVLDHRIYGEGRILRPFSNCYEVLLTTDVDDKKAGQTIFVLFSEVTRKIPNETVSLIKTYSTHYGIIALHEIKGDGTYYVVTLNTDLSHSRNVKGVYNNRVGAEELFTGIMIGIESVT